MHPKKDKTDINWHLSENVKFVSFIITTKFAFTNGVKYNYTFGVMSEFVRTKNQGQCCDHHVNFVWSITDKLSID